MDLEQPSRTPRGPVQNLWRWFLVGGSILLVFGLLFWPYVSTRAADLLANGGWLPAQGGEEAYLPLVLRNAPMQSDTPIPTVTLTPTETPTPTVTQTSTPTQTGTQPTTTRTPTPTQEGTLTVKTTLTVKVTPTQANIGGSFTFTIKVVNTGTGPTTDAVIADSFPSYIDVTSVTTSKGSVQKSAHSFTVTLGPVLGGEEITITVVAKVNNSASKTETISNVVTLSYGTTTKTASVNYKILITGLPGTGELPLDWRERSIPPPPGPSLLTVSLLGLLGGLLVLSGFLLRQGAATASRWMMGVGLLALFAALTAAFTILTRPVEPDIPEALPPITATLAGLPGDASGQAPHEPAYLYATPEAIPVVTLPSYPIPSPVVSLTPEPGESGPDTSPVVRIAIPALTLDTVVKYVPWDGLSWWIMGLREEVAWLGNTSWPGLGGNTALAAHVTLRGLGDGPFRYIEDLPVGETVILYTEQNIYSYAVRASEIVEEDDLEVTYATDNPQITLITCVDWDDALGMYTRRLIVYADLVQVEPIVRSGSR